VEVDAMMPHEGAVNFSQHCLALMVVAAAALRSVFVRSAGLNALALAASINAALVRCIEKNWGEEAAQLESMRSVDVGKAVRVAAESSQHSCALARRSY
jgi:hypothetical protein